MSYNAKLAWRIAKERLMDKALKERNAFYYYRWCEELNLNEELVQDRNLYRSGRDICDKMLMRGFDGGYDDE